MVTLIIKNYFTVLFTIGLGSLFLLAIGIYFIIRNQLLISNSQKKTPVIVTNKPTPAPLQQQKASISDLVQLTKPNQENVAQNEKAATINYADMKAIAGEDILATKLDLARALIDADKPNAAKAILNTVILQGKIAQQLEAKKLLAKISVRGNTS